MKKSGFTLLEILLSVGIISLIAGLGVPVYQSFQVRNDLDLATAIIVGGARRAQLLAQASDGDTSWGLALGAGSITLFKGGNYAARDSAYDEVSALPASLTPSGLPEIVYERFTGRPQSVGAITLTSNTNEARTITINTKGTVNF